jgi:quercetin dioxygenase-like cupin family protein
VILYGALAATFTSGRLADLPAGAGRYDGHSEGHLRRAFIDREAGSVHQQVVIAELAPGGHVERHLHAFEEAFYVLDGRPTFEAAGATEHLEADDFVFVERGVAHALRNGGSEPARWLEVSAPQPGGDLEDTVFVTGDAPAPELEAPYRKGHFDPAELPAPSAGIGLAGFGGGNVGGAAAKVIVGPDFGASQLNLMVVQYAPGGFISVHDHAFEEGFFFLTGRIEAELEGATQALEAGDYCWSAVGSSHALRNTSDQPVRWLETQVPQPPSRHQARFFGDWERFLSSAG